MYIVCIVCLYSTWKAEHSPPPGIVGFGTGEQSPDAGATLFTRDVLRQRGRLPRLVAQEHSQQAQEAHGTPSQVTRYKRNI